MSDNPVRYCHGCEQYDDHPRFRLITVVNDVGLDLLYHYDCIPAGVDHGLPDDHPALVATAAGKRGDEVRAVVADAVAKGIL